MTSGLDWRTGKVKWALDDSRTRYGQVRTGTFAVTTDRDITGPAGVDGWPFAPDLADDHRVVQLDANKNLRVVDTKKKVWKTIYPM